MKEKKTQVFTIPNLLSMLRLTMIPLLMWMYLKKGNYGWTALILVLSGITDIADGMIARKYNMVSDFGKALDPVADKLTQMAVLFCLVTRFSHLWILLALLIGKELISGIMSLLAIQKTGEIHGADWHGKVTTVLLYCVMGLHIIWYNISGIISDIMIFLCAVMMLYSMTQYWRRNRKMILGREEESLQPQ